MGALDRGSSTFGHGVSGQVRVKTQVSPVGLVNQQGLARPAGRPGLAGQITRNPVIIWVQGEYGRRCGVFNQCLFNGRRCYPAVQAETWYVSG